MGKNWSRESCIIKDLLLEFVLGSEVMRPYAANLRIVDKGRTIIFSNVSCSVCYERSRVVSEKNSLQVLSHFVRRRPTVVHSMSISPPASNGIHSALNYAVVVPRFPDLSSVLYAVSSQINLHMTSELLNALDALETAMCPFAVLRFADPTLPLGLKAVANNVAIGPDFKQGTPRDSYAVSLFSIDLSKSE